MGQRALAAHGVHLDWFLEFVGKGIKRKSKITSTSTKSTIAAELCRFTVVLMSEIW